MIRIFNCALVLVFACAAPAAQAISVYTSQATFLGALVGPVTTIDFDGEPVGALPNGSMIDGATFTNTPGGVPATNDDLFIDDFPSTTSGLNSLGTFDAFGFFSGDSLEVDFDIGPLRAVGLYVIGEIFDTETVDRDDNPIFAPVNIADTFTLATDAGNSTKNSANPDIMFDDGAAFFIGLIADDPSEYFDTFTLSSIDDNSIYYIDDISVSAVPAIPVPAAVWLFGTALLGLLGLGRKRNCKA